MKPIRLAIVAGALSAMTAASFVQMTVPAAAQDAAAPAQNNDQPRPNKRLDRLDANKDGAITKDEFSAVSKLKEADTNGDGVLSPEEITAMVQKQETERRVQRMTKRLDIDGDGKVTLAEIEAHRAKQFAVMDRNNDGKVDAREMRAGKQAKKHGGRHDRDGRRGDRHDGKGHKYGEHRKHHGQQNDEAMPDRT